MSNDKLGMIKVGFMRTLEDGYVPIYPIKDKYLKEPLKVVYLESETRRFKYVLQEIKDK